MRKLAEMIEKLYWEGYEAIGIRHMEGNDLSNSHEWDDDSDTGIELDGVCAYNLRVESWDSVEDIEEKLESALEESKIYAWLGRAVLIYGKYGEGGNDCNEIIINSPKMIEIEKEEA